MPLTAPELAEKARELLDARWRLVAGSARRAEGPAPSLDPRLAKAIRHCVNSATKSYRYALPTQILAKATDSSLDCRCIQAARGGPGAFDARSLCHKVLVPFDRENENVLGGSPEPYANNPLRVREFSREHREQQRNRPDWDRLCDVLDTVEQAQDPSFTLAVLDEVLRAVQGRLEATRVSYSIPQRIAHARLLSALNEYLNQPSGGLRLQAVVEALCRALGRCLGIFSEVKGASPTAADAATGQVADVECYSDKGAVVLAVEAKDREVTVRDISDKALLARQSGVAELLFIAQKGVRGDDQEHAVPQLQAELDRYFAGGQNVYVFRFEAFAAGVLALIGESGRRAFAEVLCGVLEGDFGAYRAPMADRKAWADLLAGM